MLFLSYIIHNTIMITSLDGYPVKTVLVGYPKVPKFSDAKNLCSNLAKIQTKRPNLMVLCQKSAHAIANSLDPDQTAPLGAV